MAPGIIFFDLEGPLSPEDHASDLVARYIPDGRRLFRVISYYDDLLALTGKDDYEPGDTLSLILPFLLSHGVNRAKIIGLSREATIVPGAADLIRSVQGQSHNVYIISTSYLPHARAMGKRLGVQSRRIFATNLDAALRDRPSASALDAIAAAERELLDQFAEAPVAGGQLDDELTTYLDEFYWSRLPSLGLQVVSGLATVVGGRRKVWAVERVVQRHRGSLRNVVFVGDSITDAAVLAFVDAAGGLSISFNGNAYAIPHATLAVAASSLSAMEPILQAWFNGGRPAVRPVVDSLRGSALDASGFPDYVWYPGRDRKQAATVARRHAIMRKRMRSSAGLLG